MCDTRVVAIICYVHLFEHVSCNVYSNFVEAVLVLEELRLHFHKIGAEEELLALIKYQSGNQRQNQTMISDKIIGTVYGMTCSK